MCGKPRYLRHDQGFFQGLTLLTAKIFWETATILCEYQDGRNAWS